MLPPKTNTDPSFRATLWPKVRGIGILGASEKALVGGSTYHAASDGRLSRPPPSLVTTVEVRFVAEGPERTRVELEHRDLDRFGPDAERMHETFGAPGAWDSTLAAFAAGVEGSAS